MNIHISILFYIYSQTLNSYILYIFIPSQRFTIPPFAAILLTRRCHKKKFKQELLWNLSQLSPLSTTGLVEKKHSSKQPWDSLQEQIRHQLSNKR
jgi:hypothetical protein